MMTKVERLAETLWPYLSVSVSDMSWCEVSRDSWAYEFTIGVALEALHAVQDTEDDPAAPAGHVLSADQGDRQILSANIVDNRFAIRSEEAFN